MNPRDVHALLRDRDIGHLCHANTVTTSCTFLEQGALLSRGYVESHGLVQTPQYSDEDDKKHGIWHSIFLDNCDIHHRGGAAKGPNKYGPVLFVVDTDVLLNLPSGSDVLVAKCNPVYWNGRAPKDRCYMDLNELASDLRLGSFDQSVIVNTPEGKMDLPNGSASIALDDPKRSLASGENAFGPAQKRLRTAARVGHIDASIEKHECRYNCVCIKEYAQLNSSTFETRFG